jgi:hypothetical protein
LSSFYLGLWIGLCQFLYYQVSRRIVHDGALLYMYPSREQRMFHVHGFASLALLAQPQPSFQLPQFCQLTYRHLHASSFGKQTMEQSTNTFLYRPLQTSPQGLRLVFIQPGSFSPINCVLKHEFLKDEPFFEALSYVWAMPKRQCQSCSMGMSSTSRPTLNSHCGICA